MDLQSQYNFQPIAVGTLGPINESTCAFLDDLGRRISLLTAEDIENMFCFNRCPALQRGSSARRFCFSRPPALVLTPAFLFTLTFKLLRFGKTVLQRVIGTLAWPCRLCSYQ